MASIWWPDLGADSHTTTWSSFTNVLGGEFGVPPAPPIPVMNLEIDSEEDPEEDPEEEAEDHITVGGKSSLRRSVDMRAGDSSGHLSRDGDLSSMSN